MTEIVCTLGDAKVEKSCAVIGNFDGIHLGHQALISHLVAKAKDADAQSVLVTFSPHPRIVLDAVKYPFLLTTQEEKLNKLLDLKLDLVVNLEFSEKFSRLTGIAFIKLIKDSLGVIGIVSGEKSAFGRDRLGESAPLAPELNRIGIDCEIIPPVLIGGEVISSGLIRSYLTEGAISKVNDFLGERYQVSGRVGHGRKFGQLIDLPTANLVTNPYKKLPGNGVYACMAWVNGKTYPAVTNVGIRPTFDLDNHTVVEAHLLDFDDNIYGKEIRLSFIDKIRNEQKFENVTLLQAQIMRDKNEARRIMYHAL